MKRPAQVRRAAGDEDPHRRGQRQHVVRRAWSTRCSVSVSAPAGNRTTCPLCRTISRTDGVLGTFAGRGTSVNTTAFSGALLFPASSPARRKTCRHQVSVLTGIPRCRPNSLSVKPLRCQRANIRRIWSARTDVVDPNLPMGFVPPNPFCAIDRSPEEMVLGHTVTLFCAVTLDAQRFFLSSLVASKKALRREGKTKTGPQGAMHPGVPFFFVPLITDTEQADHARSHIQAAIRHLGAASEHLEGWADHDEVAQMAGSHPAKAGQEIGSAAAQHAMAKKHDDSLIGREGWDGEADLETSKNATNAIAHELKMAGEHHAALSEAAHDGNAARAVKRRGRLGGNLSRRQTANAYPVDKRQKNVVDRPK
jgi:hypothetical protein